MSMAIFVSLPAGFLAGRSRYRRPRPTADFTNFWVYHPESQNRVVHLDPECVALLKGTA